MPQFTNKTTHIIIFFLIAVVLISSVIAYPSLPDLMASHWGPSGSANGYLPKTLSLLIFPGTILILYALMVIVPKTDPLKANIKDFRHYYNMFWIVLFALLTYLHLLILAWNLGHEFDFTLALIPGLAVMWYTLGVLISHSKRNWSVGIRTPWTMSSDVVWDKTHRLGGQLFKLSALISLCGIFFQDRVLAIWLILIPVLATALITIVYSYVEFRKIENTKH